jgi:excisionase family DNA binding protein
MRGKTAAVPYKIEEAERRTYKIEEVGKLLGIGRNQAYDAAKRGDFPVIRLGKRVLVPKAPFDRFLDGAGG